MPIDSRRLSGSWWRKLAQLALLSLAMGPGRAMAEGVPADLAAALEKFRTDVPPGWTYTLTTAAEGKSTVELCDATKPEFARWSLLRKNDHPPTAGETQDYFEARSRRSRGGTAPKLTDQFELVLNCTD